MKGKQSLKENKNKAAVFLGLTVGSFILSLFATAITKRYGKRK
jgi:hypothetical protein